MTTNTNKNLTFPNSASSSIASICLVYEFIYTSWVVFILSGVSLYMIKMDHNMCIFNQFVSTQTVVDSIYVISFYILYANDFCMNKGYKVYSWLVLVAFVIIFALTTKKGKTHGLVVAINLAVYSSVLIGQEKYQDCQTDMKMNIYLSICISFSAVLSLVSIYIFSRN